MVHRVFGATQAPQNNLPPVTAHKRFFAYIRRCGCGDVERKAWPRRQEYYLKHVQPYYQKQRGTGGKQDGHILLSENQPGGKNSQQFPNSPQSGKRAEKKP